MRRDSKLVMRAKVTDRGRHVQVTVQDLREDVRSTLHFHASAGVLQLVGIEIYSKSDELSLTRIKKLLPLGKWEDAARLEAAAALSEHVRMVRLPDSPSLRRAKEPRPLPPYDVVASRYRALTAAGVRNPASTIAEELGADPVSVRNWLRRCRQLGLLNAAPAERVAGEVPIRYRARLAEPPRLRQVKERGVQSKGRKVK